MSANNIKRYRHIIWDFNGTLLDDVDIAVASMNSLLCKRDLAMISKSKYREIMTSPIIDYYERLGFNLNKESFEKLAVEFINEVNTRKSHYKLHNGTIEVLNYIKNMGMGQSVLSASEETNLIKDVKNLGIYEYFTRIKGLNDHCAASKISRGRYLLLELGVKPQDVLLIGDTLHDYEVTQELGCDCLLICNGHQSFSKLSGCSTNIINNINDVINVIRTRTLDEYIA